MGSPVTPAGERTAQNLTALADRRCRETLISTAVRAYADASVRRPAMTIAACQP
tara:strand:- start:864 stop:1025 length:162 start_codon:yes stop_codon:yes gene_type:complete